MTVGNNRIQRFFERQPAMVDLYAAAIAGRSGRGRSSRGAGPGLLRRSLDPVVCGGLGGVGTIGAIVPDPAVRAARESSINRG